MGATPLTLRCPRCKKGREWRIERSGYDKRSGAGLIPTGGVRTIKRTAAGVYNVLSVEMTHSETVNGRFCGYVFWTTHPDAVRKAVPDAVYAGNASCRVMRRKEKR